MCVGGPPAVAGRRQRGAGAVVERFAVAERALWLPDRPAGSLVEGGRPTGSHHDLLIVHQHERKCLIDQNKITA